MINKKVVNFFSQSKAGAYVNTRQFSYIPTCKKLRLKVYTLPES